MEPGVELGVAVGVGVLWTDTRTARTAKRSE